MLKHKALIGKLTLEEKCHLLSGKDFWNTVSIADKGVPGIMLSDGPHGVRRQEGAGDQLGLNGSLPATCFPTAATMANSWDPALGEAVGEALGEEAANQGVGVLLGPGLNIKRSPLCGRNFEYFSEDPYLAGKMAAGYIRGIQKNGVSACPKHFAVNNTELRRQASNSVLDERTLREIYLTGFEIAVKEGRPKSIMSSYNEVNGVYANENRRLLQEILRDEWGFDGFVVSDWGAGNDFVAGVRSGAHLEMPATGGDSPNQLMKAVQSGTIAESEVDVRVDELLDVVLPVSRAVSARAGQPFDVEGHHALARRACENSAVLLKNEGGLLPRREGCRVAVIGDFAKHPRYQGAGSSVVNATRVDSLLTGMGDAPLTLVGYAQGYPRTGPGDEAMRREAVELAGKAEVALLYLGLDEISESEGLDRQHMRLPRSQVELLEAVSAVNPNVLVVLAAGSAVEMPWLERCRALLHGYLCGQAGAGALLDILCGRVNPSGRLSESYPLKYGDCSTANYFPARERSVEYREGLYVGYRFYETVSRPVLFPFGFGLSYTSFAYSDLEVSEKGATFTLQNTGGRAGAEVAQLYVSAKNPSVYRPAKELKGFTKVWIEAGERRRVTIELDDKAFRYFNVRTGRFEMDGGDYEVLIGSSVADIRLSGVVSVSGGTAPLPPEAPRCYWTGQIEAVSDADFQSLLGRPIPNGAWPEKLGMNDAICQMDRARSLKARLVWRVMTGMLNRSIRRGKPDLNIIFTYNMPFRAIGKMAGGLVSQQMSEAVVTIVNGHALGFCKGLGKVAAGFFRQRKRARRQKELA
ncbi:MAG: glycoside hydrolase family 3 C-terminal domain-containing protein [Clostridia bacterium]|nr:glycoside hydrolase family 3 C-terminal domain-containing protein [Clostridia bacterium]